ncbi:MAG: OmpA family protein, partial [Prevotellaceae bacterium]|nr:OmpA family protein [Prevotellaceae bacterium]
NATFEELKEALPDSLNPSGPIMPKTIFKPFTERDFGVAHSFDEIQAEFEKEGLAYDKLFFLEDDEKFVTSDEKTVIVNKIWQGKDAETEKSDLEILADHVKQFGIILDELAERQPFEKGTYTLELLQKELFEEISGTVFEPVEEKVEEVETPPVAQKMVETPAVEEKKCKCKCKCGKNGKCKCCWLWLLLLLIIIVVAIFLCCRGCNKTDTVAETPAIEVTESTVQAIPSDIQDFDAAKTNIGAVTFKSGASQVSEESSPALDDFVALMAKYPEMKIKINGYASPEGNAAFNQKLSEKRAKSAFDLLVKKGADAARLSYEGKGSADIIDAANPEANRRIEFLLDK